MIARAAGGSPASTWPSWPGDWLADRPNVVQPGPGRGSRIASLLGRVSRTVLIEPANEDLTDMNPVPLHYVWHYTDVDRAFWNEHLEDWLPPADLRRPHARQRAASSASRTMTEEKRRQYWVNEVGEPIGAADAERCYANRVSRPRVHRACVRLPDARFDIEASNAALQGECAERGWHRLAVVRPQWSAEHVARELDQPRVARREGLLLPDQQRPDHAATSTSRRASSISCRTISLNCSTERRRLGDAARAQGRPAGPSRRTSREIKQIRRRVSEHRLGDRPPGPLLHAAARRGGACRNWPTTTASTSTSRP